MIMYRHHEIARDVEFSMISFFEFSDIGDVHKFIYYMVFMCNICMHYNSHMVMGGKAMCWCTVRNDFFFKTVQWRTRIMSAYYVQKLSGSV